MRLLREGREAGLGPDCWGRRDQVLYVLGRKLLVVTPAPGPRRGGTLRQVLCLLGV